MFVILHDIFSHISGTSRYMHMSLSNYMYTGGDGPYIHVRTSIDLRYVDRRMIFHHFPWPHGRHKAYFFSG